MKRSVAVAFVLGLVIVLVRFLFWLGVVEASDDDDVELNVLGCRVDILGTNCDQCVCMVQCLLLYVHRNHESH